MAICFTALAALGMLTILRIMLAVHKSHNDKRRVGMHRASVTSVTSTASLLPRQSSFYDKFPKEQMMYSNPLYNKSTVPEDTAMSNPLYGHAETAFSNAPAFPDPNLIDPMTSIEPEASVMTTVPVALRNAGKRTSRRPRTVGVCVLCCVGGCGCIV